MLFLSFLTASIAIIFIRVYSDKIIKIVQFIGEVYLLGMTLAFVIIIQGVNYYLKNRELTLKETFIFIARLTIITLPLTILSSTSSLSILVENKSSGLVITIVTIFAAAFYLLYEQLFKLVKNLIIYFMKSVKDEKDRLTISVTIFGLLISLIALFK